MCRLALRVEPAMSGYNFGDLFWKHRMHKMPVMPHFLLLAENSQKQVKDGLLPNFQDNVIWLILCKINYRIKD